MKVYLAGPVEKSEDPEGWREMVEEKYPEFSWINPTEHLDPIEDDGETIIDWSVGQVIHCDALLIKWEEGQDTWFTPVEQYLCHVMDKPVVVWTSSVDDEMYMTMRQMKDYSSDSLGMCINYLTEEWGVRKN